jgi:hypothetical protein
VDATPQGADLELLSKKVISHICRRLSLNAGGGWLGYTPANIIGLSGKFEKLCSIKDRRKTKLFASV